MPQVDLTAEELAGVLRVLDPGSVKGWSPREAAAVGRARVKLAAAVVQLPVEQPSSDIGGSNPSRRTISDKLCWAETVARRLRYTGLSKGLGPPKV
jgi:hypothetical protein